jgi:hypothetical protein
MSKVKTTEILRAVAILVLRVALVASLIGAGWIIYQRLPPNASKASADNSGQELQIVLRHSADTPGQALDVTVDFYPVDVVAVRHEYFTEPRAGKRFEDFLKERMKGRSPISARLDKQGHGAVVLAPGSWWLLAKLSGDEELEWRLPLSVNGSKQIIELTPQNAYMRSKTF